MSTTDLTTLLTSLAASIGAVVAAVVALVRSYQAHTLITAQKEHLEGLTALQEGSLSRLQK